MIVKLKKSTKILALGLMIISIAGCGMLQKMPPIPTKPELPSLKLNDSGGICLDAIDTKSLGIYILELERGYN